MSRTISTGMVNLIVEQRTRELSVVATYNGDGTIADTRVRAERERVFRTNGTTHAVKPKPAVEAVFAELPTNVKQALATIEAFIDTTEAAGE